MSEVSGLLQAILGKDSHTGGQRLNIDVGFTSFAIPDVSPDEDPT